MSELVGYIANVTLPSKTLVEGIFRRAYGEKNVPKDAVSYFSNRVNSISVSMYRVLQQHGVNMGFGYIIPAYKVYYFVRDVRKLERRVEKLQSELEKYLFEGKVPEKGKLKTPEREPAIKREELPRLTERFRVRLLPYALTDEIIQKYFSRYMYDEVAKYVYTTSTDSEIIGYVVDYVKKRLNHVIKRLEYNSKRQIGNLFIENTIHEVKDIGMLLKSFGISVNENILNEFINVLNEIRARGRITEEDIQRLRDAVDRIETS